MPKIARRLLLIAIALAVVVGVTYAQGSKRAGTLRGKVVIQESQYSEECADIMVRLEGTQLMTLTDSEGRFELHEIPYGKYQLLLQSLFIKPKRTKVSIHQPLTEIREVVYANAELLAEVVIEGSSTQRKIELSGFSVDVVQPEDLARYSLSTSEILDRLPGLKVRASGGLGSRQNVNINGMSGNAIRTFINGVPQSNYGGSFSLRSIPASMIERVEVYKGVVPAYLSEDALGGAINIVLKERINNQLQLSYSTGSFHTHLANLYGSYALGKGFGLSLSAYYNYSKNDYWVWGEGIDTKDYMGNYTTPEGYRTRRFHDGYNDMGTRLALSLHNRPWVDQLSVNLIASKGYKEIQHGAKMNTVYGNRHRHSRLLALEASYQKNDFLLDGLEVDLLASYSHNIRQVVDTVPYMYDWSGHPITRPDGSYVQNNFGAEVRSGLTEGASMQKDWSHAWLLRAGVGYTFLQHHTLMARYLGNFFFRDSDDELMPKTLDKPNMERRSQKAVLAISEESSWLDNRLKTTLFYKHFWQDISGVTALVDPSDGKLKDTLLERSIHHQGFGGSVSLRVWDRLYLHASAEKAIRLPSELELFGSVAGNVSEATTLRPERSNNFNLGFNAGTYQWGPLELNGSATFFIRDTKDMIREGITLGTTVDFTFYENIESIWTRGFDAELMLRLWNRLTINSSFSLFVGLFNSKYDKNGMPHKYYGIPLKNEPSQKANVNVSYAFTNVGQRGNTLTLGANLNYVNRFPVNWIIVGDPKQGKAFIPQQNPIDLSLNYTLLEGRLSLSFDAKNILNQQLFDNLALQKPGRAFYGKLTYTIR